MSQTASPSSTPDTTGGNDSPTSFPHEYDGWAGHAHRGRPGKVEHFVGIVRGGPTSPGAGTDYSDSRYYVDRAVPIDASSKDSLTTKVDKLPGLAQTVTATNLAELTSGTHLLTAGTVVQVFVVYARGSPGAKVYLFHQTPVQAVVVKISSAATGAAEYIGKILGGVSNADATTSLAMPAGMTLPATDNALILNVEEDGETGHRLGNGTYVVGVVRGMTMDSPPRAIVVVRGGVGRSDSPTALSNSSDSSETAESSAWSKSTDGTPLNLYVVSRVIYNPAGDKTLYSFVRMLSFDARGVLLSVTAESRVTVDITESCP